MPTASITAWVDASIDQPTRELRQAVHTILVAVATAPRLPKLLVLKGGILLALRYGGDRYTRDIDFSMKETPREADVEGVVAELRSALVLAVESLDYGLDCRVQHHELRPADPTKNWPTLQTTVGYAPKLDRSRSTRLYRGEAPEVVSLDVSYNEVITAVEIVNIAGGGDIRTSTLSDLLAEKFRAMLQQSQRRRTRRQDLYDLYRLLTPAVREDRDLQRLVLSALREKSSGRDLLVSRESLQQPDIRVRSKAEYHLLFAEIASELPDFDEAYTVAQEYYEGLPW